MRTLCFDTSTKAFSIALFRDEELVNETRSLSDGFVHAERLHGGISELMSEVGWDASDLDLIGVGIGPGSYTGLRIGSSAAKGMAHALGVPLVGLDTHSIMAEQAMTQGAEGLLCPMLDARRSEVYLCLMDALGRRTLPIRDVIIEEGWFLDVEEDQTVTFFGDGMAKSRVILQRDSRSRFLEDIHPWAAYMIRPIMDKHAKKEFLDVAYFEPEYLKAFRAGKPKGPVGS